MEYTPEKGSTQVLHCSRTKTHDGIFCDLDVGTPVREVW